MSSKITKESHEAPSAETKQRFHFTVDQLKEIQSFCCLHPNTNYGNGIAGHTPFYLTGCEVVPYTDCDYGLLYNGKEVCPITDADDALILESNVGDLHFQDRFGTLMKKLHDSAYTVNRAALMH